MRDIYHCPPSELDNQDVYAINLHKNILCLEHEEAFLRSKRDEQKEKQNAKTRG